jgi:hypothetical protein
MLSPLRVLPSLTPSWTPVGCGVGTVSSECWCSFSFPFLLCCSHTIKFYAEAISTSTSFLSSGFIPSFLAPSTGIKISPARANKVNSGMVSSLGTAKITSSSSCYLVHQSSSQPGLPCSPPPHRKLSVWGRSQGLGNFKDLLCPLELSGDHQMDFCYQWLLTLWGILQPVT